MKAACILIVLAAACGSSDDDAIYDSIAIDPEVVTLTVGLGGTASQTYTVYGIQGDSRADITARCTLSIDTAFGAFAGATVTVGAHGGKAAVVANCGNYSAQATLMVSLVGDLIIGPDTPPDAPTVFDNATPGADPGRAPLLQYPLDKAVSPRNIPSIEMQWTAAGNDLFHVALSSTYANVDVYTTGVEALMTDVDWAAVAGTAAGDTLAFTVEGLSRAAPQTKYAGATAQLTMSRDTIDQTAIYWWASSQGSIMTQTFGEADAPGVVKADCTSCHSVSRAGTRIGYSRCVGGDCGQIYAGFLRFDGLNWVEAVDGNAKAIPGSYTTFAPTGNPFPNDDHALAMVTLTGGTLGLFDPDTGAAVPSNLAVANAGGTRAALMADWSGNGNTVVYAQASPGQWIDLDGGRIATMSYAFTNGQHVFGDPKLIIPDPITLPNGTYTNFFFPSFSPDSALIVFDAARSGWRNFTDARAPGQRLMLSDPNGSYVVDLTALNGGHVDADITWAHWAPVVSNDYYWIVFSSERDYGHRATAATSPAGCKGAGVQQCKQIWLAAIAKSRLGGAQDPSAPPMWVPGQDPTADNISPFWSVPAVLQ